MTDLALRAAERAYRAEPTPETKAALDRALHRAGRSSVPLEPPDADEVFRDVDVGGADRWRLRLWQGPGGSLAYRLDDDDEPIFWGTDFRPSPLHSVDGNDAVRALLSFLSLRPGDVDREYFEGYSQEQVDWAEANGEELSLYATDDDSEGRGPAYFPAWGSRPGFMVPQVDDEPTECVVTDEDTIPADVYDPTIHGPEDRRETGFGARLSAPGYLDATKWTVHETIAEARAYVADQYDLDPDTGRPLWGDQ